MYMICILLYDMCIYNMYIYDMYIIYILMYICIFM